MKRETRNTSKMIPRDDWEGEPSNSMALVERLDTDKSIKGLSKPFALSFVICIVSV